MTKRKWTDYLPDLFGHRRIWELTLELEEAQGQIEEMQAEAGVVSDEYEKDAGRSLRNLLDFCGFDWRDVGSDGVTAEEAETFIAETIKDIRARSTVISNPPATPLTFGYTNWRGEYALRTTFPIRLEYKESEWHGPGLHWVMVARDTEKNAERDFLLRDIGISPKPEPMRPDMLAALKTAYDAISLPEIYTVHPVAAARITILDAIENAEGLA